MQDPWRLSLGDIHPIGPHAIRCVERVVDATHRRLAPFYGNLEVGVPVTAVSGGVRYSLECAESFYGLIEPIYEVYARTGRREWELKKGMKELATYLNLSYVTHPRFVPATLRYAAMSAHEQWHRVLLLAEPRLGAGAGQRQHLWRGMRSLLPRLTQDLIRAATAFYLAVRGCYPPVRGESAEQVHADIAAQAIELLADFGAFMVMGPAYPYALMAEMERYEQDPHAQEHPAPDVRLILLKTLADSSGYERVSKMIGECLARFGNERAHDVQQRVAGARAWKRVISVFDDYFSTQRDEVKGVARIIAEAAGGRVFAGFTFDGARAESEWDRLRRRIESGEVPGREAAVEDVLNAMWLSEWEHVGAPGTGRTLDDIRLRYRVAMLASAW
ncbi:hypothetical protein HY631_04325 [Candidatus Uhrbacteria bacterium]|nr:hypothetical protein [Candidatus Uhrbacteria bacterium]